MSDHDAAPDPIDQAYLEAEAMLSDDTARAARRARVLAAVAREPATPAAVTTPSLRRHSAWRRGGWLAAASVAGLGMFVGTHLYKPPLRQPLTEAGAPALPAKAPSTPMALAPEDRGVATVPTPPAEASSRMTAPASRPPAAAPAEKPSLPVIQPAAPPPPAPQAFPAPAPASAPPSSEAVVTAERRAAAPTASDSASLSARPGDEAVDGQTAARSTSMRARSPAFAAALAAPLSRSKSSAGAPSDPAARLHAAAAAGRTAEVEALLTQGAPVDAPDPDGNTALMKSIKADQPGAAAVLRRHGASLDRKNHAGESARDMATAKGDAELNQALGLAPKP